MTKAEFLEKLRQALNGRVPYNVVNENIQYYDEYISVKISKGEVEQSVTEKLGDPRLLARTIIQTNGQEETSATYSTERTYEEKQERQAAKVQRMPGWLLLLIIILAAVVIISIVGSVVSFLLPVLLPIIFIMVIVGMFRRR